MTAAGRGERGLAKIEVAEGGGGWVGVVGSVPSSLLSFFFPLSLRPILD